MIKHLLPLGALLAVSLGSIAQVPVLNYSTSFPGMGTDTAREVSNIGSFASLSTPASNANWDLTNANYASSEAHYSRVAPTDPGAFPGATYAQRLLTILGGTVDYSTMGHFTLSTAGVTRVGEHIPVRQAIGLGQFTFNPNDSVVFPIQTITYTGGPLMVMKFPASIGDSWTSSASSVLSFDVTVGMMSLNNAPGERRSLRTQTDSVMGWGRMRVKNAANNQTSGWMNVLQVRTRYVVRDSFFINNAPADPLLLGALDLEQGQRDTTYEVRFFRVNEYSPVAELEYNSPEVPTGAPDFMYVMQTRIPDAAGIKNVEGGNAVKIFPNPVSAGGKLSVTLPSNAAYAYQMMSVTGAVVSSGTVKASSNNTTSLALPGTATPGIYYLMLRAEDGTHHVLPFDLQ